MPPGTPTYFYCNAVMTHHTHPLCPAARRTAHRHPALRPVALAAILDRLDAAQRSRLLRCQDARKREENWSLVRRQLANAGRFLLALPERSKGGRNRR